MSFAVNQLIGFGARRASAAPASGNDSFTKILLNMDGSNGGTTFTDSNAGGSAHTWSVISGSPVTATAAAKFGSTGLSFASGYIGMADTADITLGTSSFVFDFWINRNGQSGAADVMGQINGAGNNTAQGAAACQFTAGNKIRFWTCSGASVIGDITNSTTTFNNSTWYHIAYVRNGSNWYLFVDGVSEGTASSASSINDSANAFRIGAFGELGTFFGANTGYLDEFRLSVGTDRGWIGGFTPPTAAYS